MNLPNKLERAVSEVAKINNIDRDIVREILIESIKEIKEELNFPKYDSIEWLNFGAFTINKIGFHVTLMRLVHIMRALKKRKYPSMPLLNGLRQNFREVWYFKQELINERLSKGLQSYDKKRCV